MHVIVLGKCVLSTLVPIACISIECPHLGQYDMNSKGAYWYHQCVLLPILDNVLVGQYILLPPSDDILVGQYILLQRSNGILLGQNVLLQISCYVLVDQYIFLPSSGDILIRQCVMLLLCRDGIFVDLWWRSTDIYIYIYIMLPICDVFVLVTEEREKNGTKVCIHKAKKLLEASTAASQHFYFTSTMITSPIFQHQLATPLTDVKIYRSVHYTFAAVVLQFCGVW